MQTTWPHRSTSSSVWPETHFILLSGLRSCLGCCFSLQGAWTLDVIAGQNFFRKFAIAFGAAGSRVVKSYWFPVAGRLCQANVSRYCRLEQLGSEEAANVFRDLLSELRSLVVHRENYADDLERCGQ